MLKQFTFVFATLLVFQAARAELFWREIPVPAETLITQNNLNQPLGCMPTSLFYLFKVSPPYQTEYQALPGASDAEKLTWIYNLGAGITDPIGQPVFDVKLGVNMPNQPQYIQAIASNLQLPPSALALNPTYRDLSETTVGPFRSRIHQILMDSLGAQVPVLTSLSQLGIYKGSGKTVALFGHVVLIVGVEAVLRPEISFFQVKYLDPEDGRSHTMRVSEDVKRPYIAAVIDPADGSLDWSSDLGLGYVNTGSVTISVPYLTTTYPAPNGSPIMNAGFDGPPIVTLVGLVGVQ